MRADSEKIDGVTRVLNDCNKKIDMLESENKDLHRKVEELEGKLHKIQMTTALSTEESQAPLTIKSQEGHYKPNGLEEEPKSHKKGGRGPCSQPKQPKGFFERLFFC